MIGVARLLPRDELIVVERPTCRSFQNNTDVEHSPELSAYPNSNANQEPHIIDNLTSSNHLNGAITQMKEHGATLTPLRHPPLLFGAMNFFVPKLACPRTQDVFQSIVKGRKSWKTLRGGEVVWPPELEAALIEGQFFLVSPPDSFSLYLILGLEKYEPDDSRETRLLGRFPLRNRFISDWIFEKTGKRRTAKQVGSRLQQLRDTGGGRKCKAKCLAFPKLPLSDSSYASPYST